MWNRETGCPMHCFSLVVCRRSPERSEWLAVEETKQRGWWLPGGFCEPGDDHFETALKETKEEAGIDVALKGILRIENEINRHGGRQRVIFYAEPLRPDDAPKSVADKESLGAAWLTIPQLQEKKLRGTELLDWARYIEAGETIYPLHILASEGALVPNTAQSSG